MSDTSKDNVLGRLEGITEKLTELEIKVRSIANEKQITTLRDVQGKMTELMKVLPKQIYNFRKNDYIVCYGRLNEIVRDLKNIEVMLENLNLGLEGIKIIATFSSIEKEIEMCMRRAESKANRN